MPIIATTGALVGLLLLAYIGLLWYAYRLGEQINRGRLKVQSLLCACSLAYTAITLCALWELRSFGAYLSIGIFSLVVLLAWHWLLQPSIISYVTDGQWLTWEDLGDVPWPLESATQSGVEFTARERQAMRWTIVFFVVLAWPVSFSLGRLAMTLRAMRMR